MMIKQLEIFLFVLSCIFLIKFVILFIYNLTQEDPKPMTITKTEKPLVYLAISYIITFLIT
jgi:hypothetical protein